MVAELAVLRENKRVPETRSDKTVGEPSMTRRLAVLSVTDTTGLNDLAARLIDTGHELIASGGTAKEIESGGLDVIRVPDFTGFPEIMDGRVKTLHPKIHGGILAKPDEKKHRRDMTENGIVPIQLVVVNFYAFSEAVNSGASRAEIVEKIDIGGPALVRSAAKNHEFVGVITSPHQYEVVLDEIEATGELSSTTRELLAADAFDAVADYEAEIAAWFRRSSLRLQR